MSTRRKNGSLLKSQLLGWSLESWFPGKLVRVISTDTKENAITLRTDHFLAAFVVNNPIPVKNKDHISFIAWTAFPFGKDQVSSIWGRAAFVVRCYAVITIGTYSTLCWLKKRQMHLSRISDTLGKTAATSYGVANLPTKVVLTTLTRQPRHSPYISIYLYWRVRCYMSSIVVWMRFWNGKTKIQFLNNNASLTRTIKARAFLLSNQTCIALFPTTAWFGIGTGFVPFLLAMLA